MARTADVVIVGGGVIGLTTAYELLRAGARVTVLERGEPGREASWAGAGILPPGNPERAVDPDDRLRAVSAARFPGLSAELRELTGIINGYRKCGGFEYGSVEEPPAVERWRAEGIIFEAVSGVADRDPCVVTEQSGYFLPEMAQVRNPWHLRALTISVERIGGVICAGKAASGWQWRGDRVTAVCAGQDSYAGGEFLVCGGAWTDELLAHFGLRLGVRPVRGQMVLYRVGDAAPRHIHVWDKEYVVPRGDGLVLVGSTEEEVGFDRQTTQPGIAGLRAFAAGVVPRVSTSPVERTWAGLRPASVDGRPILGRIDGLANLSVAAGHFRSGIQLAPATGLLMAQLLRGVEPLIPLAPFRPGRAPQRAPRPAFRS